MMARRREIWFERNYAPPRVTWRPVHKDGWRALALLAGGLTSLLIAGIILPIIGADSGWTLAVALGCVAVAVSFLWSIRGRVR